MRLNADGVRNVAVIGDTASDVETALRAGAAIAAGTLTGAHNADQLRDAGATHVVGSPAEFADLVLQFNNIERP
jgi:phosphoglycolate phosphatase-like HAD superfamily hydrolase